MPTVFTHAVAGAAIAQVLAPEPYRKPLTLAAALCAMLPDADAIGFRFGVAYGDPWGHRGMTHSLLAASLLATVVVVILCRHSTARIRSKAFACMFAATASHGLLDALTNGGMGVALLAPFDETRYFFWLTPIQVSPMGARALLTRRFAAALLSEFLWVWIPSGIVMLFLRRRKRTTATT